MDADLPGTTSIVFNGLDAATGDYAVPPTTVEALQQLLHERARPTLCQLWLPTHRGPLEDLLQGELDREDLGQAGWGVVVAPGTDPRVVEALEPLLAHRRRQAGGRYKVIGGAFTVDANGWVDLEAWLNLLGANLDEVKPERLPHYLLLVGGPERIPFAAQYGLGLLRAVGRLAFDSPEEYRRYAESVVEYETSASLPRGRGLVSWGPEHPGDGATALSSRALLRPLWEGSTDGEARAMARLARARRHCFHGSEASCEALSKVLHPQSRDLGPALLFTASHGLCVRCGDPAQRARQGALVGDGGFGARPMIPGEHYLGGEEVGDGAKVQGLVAFFFGCYSAGTPQVDSLNLSGREVAPAPFVARLPQRLLAHPGGGALGVIGHIDIATGYSIRPRVGPESVAPFRAGLSGILAGLPIGLAIHRFSRRYAALSIRLATRLDCQARLTDPAWREPVTMWMERNDAQNYVLLGDPAARLHPSVVVGEAKG